MTSLVVLFLQSTDNSQSRAFQNVGWLSPPRTLCALVFETLLIFFVLLIMQVGDHRRSDLYMSGRSKLLQPWTFPGVLVPEPGSLP